MKWLTVLLFVALAGCTWFVSPDYDPTFNIPSTGATTPKGVCSWVTARVAYLSDTIHDRNDYWQSPDQTYEWGRGDCEDYALLVMYQIRQDLGGWPALVIGDVPSGRHGWIEYEGRQYEPQTGVDVTNSPNYVLDKTVEYGKAMWRSMNTHRKIEGEE